MISHGLTGPQLTLILLTGADFQCAPKIPAHAAAMYSMCQNWLTSVRLVVIKLIRQITWGHLLSAEKCSPPFLPENAA